MTELTEEETTIIEQLTQARLQSELMRQILDEQEELIDILLRRQAREANEPEQEGLE